MCERENNLTNQFDLHKLFIQLIQLMDYLHGISVYMYLRSLQVWVTPITSEKKVDTVTQKYTASCHEVCTLNTLLMNPCDK